MGPSEIFEPFWHSGLAGKWSDLLKLEGKKQHFCYHYFIQDY